MSAGAGIWLAYSDGGCLENPGGAGGWGAVVIPPGGGPPSEMSGGFASTTNNRMEAMAAAMALSAVPGGAAAELVTDSRYVMNIARGDWRASGNRDLWALFHKAREGKTVSFSWVRGHAGHRHNERCDRLASAAMRKKGLPPDPGYAGRLRRGDPARTVPLLDRPGGPLRMELPVPPGHGPAMGQDPRRLAEELGLNPRCAEAVLAFNALPREGKDAAAFMSLRTGGWDTWSGMGSKALEDVLGREAWECAAMCLGEGPEAESCLRWHGRGLSLEDALRKAMADREVSRASRGIR